VRVRAESAHGEQARLVDPFNHRVIDNEDCQEVLDSLYGGQIALSDEHLPAATNREILARLLRNLKAVYTQGDRYARAVAVIDRLMLLDPEARDEHRDRGALLAQLGRYTEAIEEMQTYLSRPVADAEEVREQLKKVQIQQAMLS
jgi:regulator of sirC expression with transglutaminase-like and TPR domain